jgi:hypothetical protein
MLRYRMIYPVARALSDGAMWLDSFHDGHPRFAWLWHLSGSLELYADECALRGK